MLFNKVSFCNFNTITINNSDRKRYRITSSILNILIETPQVNMCKKYFQYINFYKCGSKFIAHNKNLLNSNNKKYTLWNKIDRNKCKNNLNLYLKKKEHTYITNRHFYEQSYFNNTNNIYTDCNSTTIMDYELIKDILNSNVYNSIYNIVNEYYLSEK